MHWRKCPPNWWTRIWHGRTAGFAVGVSTLGIDGVVLTGLSAAHVYVPLGLVAFTAVACVTIALIAAYLYCHLSLIPDSFVEDMESVGHYEARYCSAARLRESCALSRPYYGEHYVQPDIAEQWRLKNPKGFVEIVDGNETHCAAFGVLSFKESFMDLFVDGTVSEEQLRSEDILDIDASQRAGRLYISGVIVRDATTFKGSKYARILVWSMLRYLESVYGFRRKHTLYAISVTRESELLMKNLGFNLVSGKAQRADKSDMYSLELSRTTWSGLMKKVGDLSQICDTHY